MGSVGFDASCDAVRELEALPLDKANQRRADALTATYCLVRLQRAAP